MVAVNQLTENERSCKYIILQQSANGSFRQSSNTYWIKSTWYLRPVVGQENKTWNN
jgi:hypothetical protein